jgi:hypothetical protein
MARKEAMRNIRPRAMQALEVRARASFPSGLPTPPLTRNLKVP